MTKGEELRKEENKELFPLTTNEKSEMYLWHFPAMSLKHNEKMGQ